MTPRIALGAVRRLDDRLLRFGAQLGLAGVIVNTPLDLPGETRWAVDDLRRMRERVEAYDLRVEAVENVPTGFYRDAILGGPAQAEQLVHMRATIQALGEAGIPVFGFHW